jgi:hypothetical protein
MTAMTRILIMALTLWLSIEPVLAQSLDGNVDVQGPADAALFVVDSRDPYFEKRSSLKVGAKGEEHIDVSSADVCQAFHHAELIWLERRFAEAQFVQIPEKACTDCEPLIVRWYHEPTGRAHFHVRVYRTACPAGDRSRDITTLVW